MAFCIVPTLAILLVIPSLFHEGEGAVIIDSAESKEIPGYTLLAQWEDPNSRASTRAISYYFSDPGFEKTQFEAYFACTSDIGGRVAAVLNKSQYDAIRLKLITSEHKNIDFWIDGQQSGTTWYYMYNSQAIQPSQLTWNPSCSTFDTCGLPLTNQGLTMGGDLARFGMCLKDPNQLLGYICEI